MTTINLPAEDCSGKLTPLVLEAMKNGATSAHHAEHNHLITLTFKDDADPMIAEINALMAPAKKAK